VRLLTEGLARVDERELTKLMAEMNVPEDGEVSFEQFRVWWKRKEAKVHQH
jgi:Ca2+-binding EF-hand superfamily protein